MIEGMDVVKAILAAPASPTKGEGVMKGQMLEPVVKIVKAEPGGVNSRLGGKRTTLRRQCFPRLTAPKPVHDMRTITT